MDPYLEPHWRDVYTALIAEARRQLNRSLPQGLIARAEERIAVESDEHLDRRIGRDIRVFSPSTADPDAREGDVVIHAPYKMVVEYDPIIERFIRILDEGGELVTVIEFLSPTNKLHPGIETYRTKRRELLAAGVHVVEVDLIRAGDWRALMRPERCPEGGVTMYRATIRTTGRRPGAYLYPIALQRPLPEISIPLRPGEAPTPLHLQVLLDAVYEDGRYDQTLDYTGELDPPLPMELNKWADQVLKAAQRR